MECLRLGMAREEMIMKNATSPNANIIIVDGKKEKGGEVKEMEEEGLLQEGGGIEAVTIREARKRALLPRGTPERRPFRPRSLPHRRRRTRHCERGRHGRR